MPLASQVPGKEYTFVRSRSGGEKDTGILPDAFGKSNDFARWIRSNSPRSIRGGSWTSKKFHQQARTAWRMGYGPSGLRGRMVRVLYNSRAHCEERGYASPNATPDQLVVMWNEQNGVCAACGSPINLFWSCLDHSHETGECRGFIHAECNTVEGFLLKMSNDAFEKYIEWIKKIHNRSL